jgi:peptidoglycan/xylan/chitin deacetylase (PgdA/CDA1 family)
MMIGERRTSVERRSPRHPQQLLNPINLAWVRTKTKIVHQAGTDKLRLSDQKIMIPRLASRLSPVGLFAKARKSAQVRLARNIKLHAFGSHLTEPVVSFAFDDFPRSALTEGGRMLNEAGWAGTYFTAGGLCGRTIDGLDYFDREDILRADRAGHEIACHTFGPLRLPDESRGAIDDDLQRNAHFFLARNFAPPASQ